jgi:hypothetical protein
MASLDERDGQIPVLVAGDRHERIEAADLDHRVTLRQRRRADGVLGEKVGEVAALRRPVKLRLAERPEPAAGERQGVVRLQRVNGAREERRLKEVVCVEEREIASSALFQAEVSSGGQALVPCANDARLRPPVRTRGGAA